MSTRPARWAALGAVAALAAAFAAWGLTTADPASLTQRFTPEHVDLVLMIDSGPQRRAHLAACLATLAGCGLAVWFRARGRGGAVQPIPGWRSHGRWWFGPLVAVGLCAIVDAPAAALVCSALAVAVVSLIASPPPLVRTVLVGLLTSYALFLLVPGIFATPDLATSPPFPLYLLEWHYAQVVSPGDRLASGLELFNQVIPPYGVMVPTLLGAWERRHGLLSWGVHIQLVHVMNLLFVSAAAAAALAWFRRFPAVCITLLALLPWLSSFHSSTLFPNQSALRFLGLPCAVFALVWLSAKPRTSWGPSLGLAMGALALFNPETAIASGAGVFVFLCLRLGRGRELVRTVLQLVVVALVPIAVWLLAYRWWFEVWPLPSTLSALFHSALRFSGGYGGFGFEKLDIAIVMLVHAVFCVVIAFARRDNTRRGAIRAAIGTTLIVWFAYYANRGAAGNLWSYLFLYSFLLDGWLHPLSLRRALRHARRGQLSARTACFALIFVVPAITGNVRSTQRVLEEGFSPPPPAGVTEVLSGVLLPTQIARAIQEKADFLARTEDAFYLTTNAYTVPLLVGRFPDSPLGDPFGEAMTPADTQRLQAFIRGKHPARLLFDDPDSSLTGSNPQQQRYFERVRDSFADQYEVEGTASGWLVLRRRSPR